MCGTCNHMGWTVSDEKRYTERDLIMAKREGYVQRARETYLGAMPLMTDAAVQKNAALTYPLPKVERPRVVADPICPAWEICVINGEVYARETGKGRQWEEARLWNPKPARVRVWADLLDRPNEMVEE